MTNTAKTSQNENIMAWISDCSVGPSFLSFDSSPSWDLSGGMTFPFQQSLSLSYVTTHLFNKYFLPFYPWRITSLSLFFYLSTRSYSPHLYAAQDFNLPGSNAVFWRITTTLVLNHVMKKPNGQTAEKNWYHNRGVPVWTGNGLVFKSGSSFVFWRHSFLVFVQMTNKYRSCVCLRLGAEPHSNKAVIIYLVRVKTRLSSCCSCEKNCTENMWKYIKLPRHTHKHTHPHWHQGPGFLTLNQAQLEGKFLIFCLLHSFSGFG